jgi:hypothetical protein
MPFSGFAVEARQKPTGHHHASASRWVSSQFRAGAALPPCRWPPTCPVQDSVSWAGRQPSPVKLRGTELDGWASTAIERNRSAAARLTPSPSASSRRYVESFTSSTDSAIIQPNCRLRMRRMNENSIESSPIIPYLALQTRELHRKSAARAAVELPENLSRRGWSPSPAIASGPTTGSRWACVMCRN